MKFRLLFVLSILVTFFLISCGSTPKTETTYVPDIEDEVEDINDDVVYVDSEDDVELIDEIIDLNDEDDDEYIRSTNELSLDEIVTKEEFVDDKAAILEIIEELKVIMKKGDVNAWLKYIDPESINYYSSPAVIRKIEKKLPNKTIKLNGIGDYFKYVWIPARNNREITEIRYISKNEVNAVDIKENGKETTYYTFVKKNNKWLVNIPKM